MRRPWNHQLLSASMLRFRTSASGMPRCQNRHSANVPSALDATIARATPAAIGHARGSADQAKRKIADTNRTAVAIALTSRNVSTCVRLPGLAPAAADGSRK